MNRIAFARYVTTAAVFCVMALAAVPAPAAPQNKDFDDAGLVLGQSNFFSAGTNFVDGNGLDRPCDIALDKARGRVYVADTYNNRVLWWDSIALLVNGAQADGVLGQLSTTASGINRNETPSRASLNHPAGIAVDSAGNVWVADTNNNRVLRFPQPRRDSDNAADLVLGQPDFAVVDAPGINVSSVTLSAPVDLSVDADGSVWVADTGSNRVLRFPPGSANGAAADLVLGQDGFDTDRPNRGTRVGQNTLYAPAGITIDAKNNIWIADTENNRVVRYSSPRSTAALADTVIGQLSFTANGLCNGGATATGRTLYEPRSIAVDDFGYVWVSDAKNNRLLRFFRPVSVNANAEIVLGQINFTLNGANRKGPLDAGTLNFPCGVTLDGSGNVWVADTLNHRILRFTGATENGRKASLVLGQDDLEKSSINMVDRTGLSAPSDVAIDQRSGRVYVADTANNRVLWWNEIARLMNGSLADGVLGQYDFRSNQANRGGALGPDTLYKPMGVAVDAAGAVWVADTFNHRVLRFEKPSINGSPATLVLGQRSVTANGYGTPSASSLSFPNSVAADAAGNVWVVDGGNHRVLRFSSPSHNGDEADLVLGQIDFMSRYHNRGAQTAQNTLCYPGGIFIDNAGCVWVADTGNNRVLRFSSPAASGVSADLVLGQKDFKANGGGIEGKISASILTYPGGVCVDHSGRVWVADIKNNRVLMYAQPFSNGMTAQSLLGQKNMEENLPNRSKDGNQVNEKGLNQPSRVAVDGSGMIWVVDSGNNRILKY